MLWGQYLFKKWGVGRGWVTWQWRGTINYAIILFSTNFVVFLKRKNKVIHVIVIIGDNRFTEIGYLTIVVCLVNVQIDLDVDE